MRNLILLSVLLVGCSTIDVSTPTSNEDEDPVSDPTSRDTQPTDTTSTDSGVDSYTNAPENDSGLDSAASKPAGYCDTEQDCESKVCINKQCQPASPTDGIQNGDETGVDCGGKVAPKCALEKSCLTNNDCESGSCRYDHVCTNDRSCVYHYGGDTCGAKEVGDPKASHESCCKRITIPTGAQVDKYKVTAGRMRAMIDSTKGDVKGWYLTNRDNLSTQTQEQIDPFVDYLPTGMAGEYGVYQQLGSHIWILDQPSIRQGCYIGSVGTHTYWFPPEVNALEGDVAHGFSQEVLDTKPVQCLTMPMAAAFCAWDGGRLQTFEENKAIYGSARFPWGESPEPGGYRVLNGVWTLVGPADLGFGSTLPSCPTCLDTLTNWSNNYEYPPRNPNAYYDYSYWISAPGRFVTDKGPYGHMDVAGDLIEMTGTKTDYIDKQGRSPTYRWGWQGSWEGHEVKRDGYAFYFMVKYGKTGARCAR